MRRRNLTIFFLGALLSFAALADDSETPLTHRFDYREEKFKGEFSFGLEGAQIQSTGSSLTGIGPRIGVDYDLGANFSVNPSASVAMDGNTIIYSGFNGYLRYSILGSLSGDHKVLTFDGKQSVDQSTPRSNRLSVGLGVEQLFLNGTQSVYPAAGFSATSAYSFKMFSSQFEVAARYSQMVANSKSFTGIFIDFSFLLGL